MFSNEIFLVFLGEEGRGPSRGLSPVEWGEFLFIHSLGWLAGSQVSLGLSPVWVLGLAGPDGGGIQMYKQKIPLFYSTGFRPLLGPLPKKDHRLFFKEKAALSLCT